jgi:membrane carboxypeptidase/penicillin-binding protein
MTYTVHCTACSRAVSRHDTAMDADRAAARHASLRGHVTRILDADGNLIATFGSRIRPLDPRTDLPENTIEV